MTDTTSEKIRLTNVRLSFPRLFKPKSFKEGQTPRFEASALLDPSNEEHQAIIDDIREKAAGVIKAKFNGKFPKGLKLCFGHADGETQVDVGPNKYRFGEPKEYDGYEGMFVLSSSNQTKPKVVDRRRNDVTEESGLVYAGCYVNMTITLWAQDNEYGKRVNANLRAVQFVRDGDAFGVAPVDADEEFDEVEIDDDEKNWDE